LLEHWLSSSSGVEALIALSFDHDDGNEGLVLWPLTPHSPSRTDSDEGWCPSTPEVLLSFPAGLGITLGRLWRGAPPGWDSLLLRGSTSDEVLFESRLIHPTSGINWLCIGLGLMPS
jgi:hypothetical protein